jgi:hypothetical protein
MKRVLPYIAVLVIALYLGCASLKSSPNSDRSLDFNFIKSLEMGTVSKNAVADHLGQTHW